MFLPSLFIQVYLGVRGFSAKLHSSKLLLIGILDRTKGNLLDYLFGGGESSKPLENNININLGSQAFPLGFQGTSNQETEMIRQFLLKDVGRNAFVPPSLIDLLLTIAKDNSVGERLKSNLFKIAADLFTHQQVTWKIIILRIPNENQFLVFSFLV